MIPAVMKPSQSARARGRMSGMCPREAERGRYRQWKEWVGMELVVLNKLLMAGSMRGGRGGVALMRREWGAGGGGWGYRRAIGFASFHAKKLMASDSGLNIS